MKKKHFAVLTFALCFSLLSTACGTSKNSTESTQTQKGLVLTVSSTADFVDQATTLQELIDSSDIVAKVNVQKLIPVFTKALILSLLPLPQKFWRYIKAPIMARLSICTVGILAAQSIKTHPFFKRTMTLCLSIHQVILNLKSITHNFTGTGATYIFQAPETHFFTSAK